MIGLVARTATAQIVVPTPVPAAPVAAPAAAPAPTPPAFPDFALVTKDMQVIPGIVTLFRYRPDDPSKDQTRLLCQIPRGLFRQDLLLATSISRGAMAGYMTSDYLIRFEQVGKNIVINTPDPRFIQLPGQPVNDVIGRTYTDGFLAAMPIVTMTPTGDPVVDMGSALMDPSIMGIGMAGGYRRDLSQYTKVKSFPDNALIEVEMAMGGRGGGQRIGLFYSLRRLPDLASYRPRTADERVGYFTTVRQNWATKFNERETIVRYINRWNVKKRDASLEMSPPERPIVFIIEKTVPLQWRKYVADGILEWNKAYEKLGIVDAIVVHQQTEDNEFAQVDPEDARYNFFRWIVTGDAFAMGPSRADPRTGQILDADIIYDDSLARSFGQQVKIFSPLTVAATLGPEMPQFLREHPEFVPFGQTLEPQGTAAEESGSELLREPMCPPTAVPSWHVAQHSRECTGCSYAVGLRQQIALAQLAAAATTMPSKKQLPERLLGEMIRHVVTHEVGHTLGLRHNFKASSWLSLEEIRKRRDTSDEPTTASVMDYNGFLLLPGDDPAKVRHFASPAIGPYDYWAIDYGYRTPEGDEKAMLAKIASQGTQRELSYLTDEDTMGLTSPDPLSNRWDMSDDPITWARTRISLCDNLIKDIRKWAIQKDEPNEYLRSTFETLSFEKTRNLMFVSRLVGGQFFNRNRAADPQARPTFVLLDPQRQRDAVNMLAQTAFRDDFFVADPDLLNDLGPSRWWDWASRPTVRIDYPVHQMISSLQGSVLMNLCTPQVIQRIYDAELKSKGPDRFTAAELITTVRNAVWTGLSLPEGEHFTDAKPMLTSVRRNLQRQHLQYLLALADEDGSYGISPDVQSMARFALRELGDQIGAVLAKAPKDAGPSRLDFATRAHLTECKSRIDRVLSAPYIKLPQPRMMLMMEGAAAQKQ